VNLIFGCEPKTPAAGVPLVWAFAAVVSVDDDFFPPPHT